ncbi:MAG UNVERIFIED_CONTAM: hypothetical protein LVT10_00675 [Anaerolineae bacterium]
MRILQQGRTAYLLVPEIALTPQTAQRVAGRFPRRVATLDSGMNEAERYDVWRRAEEGSVQVMVGKERTVCPLPHVGIIILDEAHDPSYKQHPNVDLPPFRSAPHYDTRLLAQKMGEFHNAVVIYWKRNPRYGHRLRRPPSADGLPSNCRKRIMGHRRDHPCPSTTQQRESALRCWGRVHQHDHDLPRISWIMQAELRSGNRNIFSRALHTALTQTLQRGEQAILFSNRVAERTPLCSVEIVAMWHSVPIAPAPLTYHEEQLLRRHQCGYAGIPHSVPNSPLHAHQILWRRHAELMDSMRVNFPSARVVRCRMRTPPATSPNTSDC